jgi:uncharacterized FlaG/YvyC family protein
MQIGRLEEIDQSKFNHTQKISKVENLEKKHTVNPDEQYKNVMEQGNKVQKNEVILDNVKFGFDKDTNQFFVRISENGQEIQFPTEQIMKMKANFKDMLSKLNNDN